ncbi:MAG: sensor histidine kinase [Acidimicrobiales bacterium]
MASFSRRLGVPLSASQESHLVRLVGWWGLLADFSFADLLLFVPVNDKRLGFKMVAHVRPTTNQTLYNDDVLEGVYDEVQRPLLARAYRDNAIVRGEITLPETQQRARVTCIPVCLNGQPIAMLTREAPPALGRRRGELEVTYLKIFDRFALMVAQGSFPFDHDETDVAEAPRVGDGVIHLDADARVIFASPNAVSSLHRLGVLGNARGQRLIELGLQQQVVQQAFQHRVPVSEEMERDDRLIMHVLAIPLLREDRVVGAVVIMRDVTELRSRDRLLLTKDATIREVHHRVKNNLQTISALLRLQSRRMESSEARLALEESVRRIGSIALVHEALAHEAGQDVPLLGVMEDLVQYFSDSLLGPERRIRIAVSGGADIVPAEVVTPLAVVLNEFLQNVVDHAFGDDLGEEALVEVRVDTRPERLVLSITDNGLGLKEDFDPAESRGLGLLIVQALIDGELGGQLEMKNRSDGVTGTEVRVIVPLQMGR